MSIIRFIQQQKDKVLNYRSAKISDRLRREAENLRAEKIRQAEIAKASAMVQKQRRDVDAIRGYNERVAAARPKNALMKLGEGLAGAMNRNESVTVKNYTGKKGKKQNKKGAMQGAARLAQNNQGSRGLDFGSQQGGNSMFSTPARNLDVGESQGSPFNQGVRVEKRKNVFN